MPIFMTLLYRVVPVPLTPLMVIRLAQGEGFSKDWVPLSEISPFLAQAVVAGEDNRFCEHGGYDWTALQAAFSDYLEGDRLRGASTISMQTAKNVFLWDGRNLLRKLLEAPLTLLIEGIWPKERIVEVYLNVVEFGPGIYGAEAAARDHFGKPAAKLTRFEATLLAAVLPSPRTRSASQPTGSLRSRARTIAKRIDQLGPLLDCVKKTEKE